MLDYPPCWGIELVRMRCGGTFARTGAWLLGSGKRQQALGREAVEDSLRRSERLVSLAAVLLLVLQPALQLRQLHAEDGLGEVLGRASVELLLVAREAIDVLRAPGFDFVLELLHEDVRLRALLEELQARGLVLDDEILLHEGQLLFHLLVLDVNLVGLDLDGDLLLRALPKNIFLALLCCEVQGVDRRFLLTQRGRVFEEGLVRGHVVERDGVQFLEVEPLPAFGRFIRELLDQLLLRIELLVLLSQLFVSLQVPDLRKCAPFPLKAKVLELWVELCGDVLGGPE